MGAIKKRLRRWTGKMAAAALRRRSNVVPAIDGVLLVVAPHPDDETLGCGGLIARQAQAGRRVHVIFLTDGEASHAGHPGVTAQQIGAQRQAEALAALEALGVPLPRSAATFLGAPDGRLDKLAADERQAIHGILVKWMRADQPEVVCVPFLGGGSTEHDAAFALVEAALRQAGGGVIFEYPIWAWWNPFRLRDRIRSGMDNYRLPLGTNGKIKLQALACHRSQLEPTPPWTEPLLPPEVVAACCGPDEFFFRRRVLSA